MERNQNTDRFEYTIKGPAHVGIVYSKERSAVNSICIVTGKQWSDVVRCYIDQCHWRANMASYKTCRTDTLRVSGFTPYRYNGTVQKFLDHCNAACSERNAYIVKIFCGYAAVLPNEKTGQYVLRGAWPKGALLEHMRLEEVWLYVPGSDNRTGIKHLPQCDGGASPQTNLTIKNMNPENRLVGDCVIRALSAAYGNGCTWHQAMDLIAEATHYSDPVLNRYQNIQLALSLLGFEHHKGIRRNGRLLSGNQFCEYLNYVYTQGERIFAYFGKHHCAAVLPVRQTDHSVKYMVQDTWDSTTHYIEEYWVFRDEEPPKEVKKKEKTVLEVGSTLIHPQFGAGVISQVTQTAGSQIIKVDFEKVGPKWISEEWLEKELG